MVKHILQRTAEAKRGTVKLVITDTILFKKKKKNGFVIYLYIITMVAILKGEKLLS